MNIGDVIRIVCAFNNPDGSALLNVFTFLLTAVGSGAVSDLLDDAEAWANDFYSNWLASVSDQITSDYIRVMLRDDVAGEWNTLGERTWTGTDGQVVADSTAQGVAALLTAYPGQPRHRGRKFLPPAQEASFENGIWASTLATNLGLTLARYLTTLSETNYTGNPGVYQESAEQFRGFAGSGTFSLIPSYQRRRKNSVGV